MWPLIAALIASALGFTAGMVGNKPASYNRNTSVLSPTPFYRACYNPEPDQIITLNWPNNFIDLPDHRRNLRPDVFASFPETFNSIQDEDGDGIADCKASVMNSKTTESEIPSLTRNFIKVRSDVRISSCKTDEQAGQYASDYDCGWDPKQSLRGSCFIKENVYPPLRKIAETAVEGEIREIFWNPFSYNNGCNYEEGHNCGPGDWNSPNLKDFIYVLKRLDAVDKTEKPNCPSLWDAGSSNESACSHYFDVYLAEDTYQAMQTAGIPQDPNERMYFLKKILENCREQSTFTPLPDSMLWIPPSFIRKPFLPPSIQNMPGKINPVASIERVNYQSYIWSKPNKFVSSKTNLLKSTERPGTLNICPGSSSNCYDPIGTIDFRDEDGNSESYRVYSQRSAPETFVLVKISDPTILHTYFITQKDLPAAIGHRDPSLQLKNMEFLSQNSWTWATPWCKPAIYLYPEKETTLTVKLNLAGELTADMPAYDPNMGWQVKASADGQLIVDNKIYPYLYYEANIKGNKLPEKGWVVEKSKVKTLISKILAEIGFNPKEITDFSEYWLPKLKEKPYYFVTFLPEEEINLKEQLIFSQEPDTIIRARVIFEGLAAPFSVTEPEIHKKKRKGFTVTDWGATLINHSCSDWKME